MLAYARQQVKHQIDKHQDKVKIHKQKFIMKAKGVECLKEYYLSKASRTENLGE